MRVVIWAAVSSPTQASEDKESIPAQLESARELIERTDGWHEAHEPLIIPGHSRSYIFLADAAADMPVYTDLMQIARSGEIDLLLCRGRDRLGRTDALIAQVEEYLASYNVQILSLSMPTTVQEPDHFAQQRDRASIWMRSVERARAQDEIAELRTRHRMGMRKRVQMGLHACRVPLGYRLGPEGHGIIHGSEAAVIRLLARWTLEGLPYRDMVRRLPEHTSGRHPTSATMIQQTLANPYYAGFVSYHRRDRKHGEWRDRSDWLIAPGLHDAILDEQTWERLQTEMEARRHQGSRSATVIRPLSGILYCADCGSQMIIRGGSERRGYRYYACETCTGADGLHHNTLRDDLAHLAVIDWLLERARDPQLLDECLNDLRSEQLGDIEQEAQALTQAVGTKRAALERYRRDYEEGYLERSDYYGQRLRLQDELAGGESRLAELERKRDAQDPERVRNLLAKFPTEQAQRLRNGWRDPQIARPLKALLRQMALRVRYSPSTGLSIQLSP